MNLLRTFVIVAGIAIGIQCTVFALGELSSIRHHALLAPFTAKVSYLYKAVTQTLEMNNLAALYQATINPNMKYVAVVEGMRKEEMAEVYQKALNWDAHQKEEFAQALGCYSDVDEGYLYPAGYVIPRNANPGEVKEIMKSRFDQVVEPVVEKAENSVLSIETAVNIASIIQREAAGKRDMNLISGIIWNRLFTGMPLQLDATLQYVKGDDGLWWPQVKSADKYLESPYNTYQNKGLPPTAISNPGIAAIEAAFNPEKTACIFYLHDAKRRIHCAKTYEEHKRNVDMYLK